MSYMQVHPDDAMHKDKGSKWSLFSRNNSHVDESDRRKDEKVMLSAKEIEARKMERQRGEERDQHWQFIDQEETKEQEPFRRDDRTVDRDRERAELTRMIGETLFLSLLILFTSR